MVVNIIFNPIFALFLFTTGIWMASMIDPVFGLITILGGSLLGFSPLSKNDTAMGRKTKVLLFGAFFFLLSLMSLTYLAIKIFFL